MAPDTGRMETESDCPTAKILEMESERDSFNILNNSNAKFIRPEEKGAPFSNVSPSTPSPPKSMSSANDILVQF